MFGKYLLLTLATTSYCLVNAYDTREQFYPTVLYLLSNKTNLFTMCNFGVALLCVVYKVVSKLFLGRLTDDEILEIFDQAKYAVMETLLALTIFNRELNVTVFALFMVLLLVKVFHWLAAMRVELVARNNDNVSTKDHARLNALMAFLVLTDFTFTAGVLHNAMQTRTASVLLLFGFEYSILLVGVLTTFCKYLVYVHDHRRGGRWQHKSVVMFYLDTCADLVRLMLYLAFFAMVCTFYGMPLHLIRELSLTFYHLRERTVKFYKFRKLTANMNERFRDATSEELASDAMCVVCWDTMESAKRLPCSHMFHVNCLRDCLESSQRCPVCRADIPLNARVPVHQAAAPAAAPAPAAAAPAAPPAPAQAVVEEIKQPVAVTGQPAERPALERVVSRTTPPPDLPPALVRQVSEHAQKTAWAEATETETKTERKVKESPKSSQRPGHTVMLRPFPSSLAAQPTEELYYTGQQQTVLLEQHLAMLEDNVASVKAMLEQHKDNQNKMKAVLERNNTTAAN